MPELSTIVLFADLSDSVQLYETLGDAAAKSIIVDLQEKFTCHALENSGIVQEIIGDEIMCRFECAEDAIKCAASIHQCAAEYNEDAPQPGNIQMRIGIHCGQVILDDNRLFGDTVNTAARITAIASAGQTLTTQTVFDLLSQELQTVARKFDNTTLKGKAKSILIYDFPCQSQDLTQIQEVVVESKALSLELIYQDQTYSIAKESCPAKIGRATNSFIVVDDKPVSRRHVSIDFLRGRFVLTDRSTNGTHVYPDNSEEIYLRREQIPLWGSGKFSLGAPQEEVLNVIEFNCETLSDGNDV